MTAFAIVFSIMSCFWPVAAQETNGIQPKVETSYDSTKDQTTVRLSPVKISGLNGKYHSLHMSPYFTYQGKQPQRPAHIDFELQSVVKGRLRTDLYVVFIIDGETIFLSSSRWAVRRPIPGRVWMGERLVFRMPYETFTRLSRAKSFEVKFDTVRFPVGEKELATLQKLLAETP